MPTRLTFATSRRTCATRSPTSTRTRSSTSSRSSSRYVVEDLRRCSCIRPRPSPICAPRRSRSSSRRCKRSSIFELAFVVDSDQVSVRVNGVVQPLIGQRQPLRRPCGCRSRSIRVRKAGVRVVETNVVQRPAAPPPTHRGQPAAAVARAVGADRRRRQAPERRPRGQPRRNNPRRPSRRRQPAPADKPDKPEGGDDASAQFCC